MYRPRTTGEITKNEEHYQGQQKYLRIIINKVKIQETKLGIRQRLVNTIWLLGILGLFVWGWYLWQHQWRATQLYCWFDIGNQIQKGNTQWNKERQ